MANIEMVIDSIKVSLMDCQAMQEGEATSGLDDRPRVLILKEKAGERYLPIWVGPAEADAIAVEIQGVKLSRPLAHDLMCATIDALDATVQSAIIRLENDCYYAKVILESDKGQKEIDCPPADALAVATRKDVSIFADEKALEKAGIVLLDEKAGTILLDEGT